MNETAAEATHETETIEHKYSVGIDLGTTNCLLSYVEIPQSELEEPIHKVMEIPQLTAAGQVENRIQLPSFL